MTTTTWLESFWQDLRYGARVLRRSPAFAIVALLSLALGIGANAALFQLLDVVRLRSLPVPRPEELVEIRIAPNDRGRTGEFSGSRPNLTNPQWELIRAGGETVKNVFAWGVSSFDLSAGGESHIVQGLFVSGGYFRALETMPALGRLIEAADDVRGCAATGAVISHSFWQREFGGAADVLSRTLRLDGAVFPIVGVTPRGFTGNEVGRRFDVFVPICTRPLIKRANPGLDRRDMWWLSAFGRLAPGVTTERATAELNARSQAIMTATAPPNYAAADATNYQQFKLQAVPASAGVSTLRTRYGTSLGLLLGIAGLVLLIACANLANLMLARSSARSREIAVRLAIGASRRRVFRQLVAESLLLAGAGAVAGIGIAVVLSRLLLSILTSDGSAWALNLTLDWRLIGFTLALAVVTCVTFGLMPAVRATRTPPGSVLKLSSRGLTADRGRFLFRRVLVIGQVAISLVLVVGALLLVRTLRNLALADPGFLTANVLEVDLDLRPAGVDKNALLTYQSDLLQRLASLPGVVHASSAGIVPISGSGWNETLIIDGKKQEGHPDANRVSAEFFRTLGVAMTSGRTFDDRDRPSAPPVAVVNEAFVKKYFPAGPPIGKTFRIQVGPGQPDFAWEIVGIVKNTKYRDLREPLGPIMYFADTQEPDPAPFLTVLMRTDGDPNRLRAAVTKTIADVHPAIVLSLDTFETVVRNSLLRERLMASLSAGFAILAVILAAAGLYGLMSYGVARRRNEIGIRVALGATRAVIVGMILREVIVLVAIGVTAGVGLSVWVGRTAATLLYEMVPSDPATIAMGVAALVAVAALASAPPAGRAARLNPTVALRED